MCKSSIQIFVTTRKPNSFKYQILLLLELFIETNPHFLLIPIQLPTYMYNLISTRQLHIFSIKPDMQLFGDFYVFTRF